MTRLEWGVARSRVFQTGIDRGVLYVGDNDGVPWNGLVAVNESSSGGDAKGFYLDGVKYANRSVTEEYQATLEAYTYPEEFAVCDGTTAVSNGLFATRQRRKSFGLSYRTKIGDDVDGIDHAYKIHLVYNAIAAPSTRQHLTLSEKTDASNFSWAISTKPSVLNGNKPTPHLIIDSRYTPAVLLAQIEDILYGNNNQSPRLPSVNGIAFYFQAYNATRIDALDVSHSLYGTIDGGTPSTVYSLTFDGGTP